MTGGLLLGGSVETGNRRLNPQQLRKIFLDTDHCLVEMADQRTTHA